MLVINQFENLYHPFYVPKHWWSGYIKTIFQLFCTGIKHGFLFWRKNTDYKCLKKMLTKINGVNMVTASEVSEPMRYALLGMPWSSFGWWVEAFSKNIFAC